jgi:hypothetical protein|tara:strand:- start:407 stop:613 length:207 start_codon:yes stop_codon:yes gene_type:complete
MALTLAQIETAITAVMDGGQSVTMDGTTYSAANIKTLFAMRSALQNEGERAAGTRPVFRRGNVGGAFN